jgi:hypothetical protein
MPFTGPVQDRYRTGRTPYTGAVKLVPAIYRPCTGKKGMCAAERALILSRSQVCTSRSESMATHPFSTAIGLPDPRVTFVNTIPACKTRTRLVA